MNVKELLMNIKSKEFKLDKGLEVKAYLPIEVKKTIAQGIIFECTDDTAGVIKVDSVQRYMAYVRHMITTHTNLEYTDDHYDMLCSTEYDGTNLLNAILNCFGGDAAECMRILDLMMNDYMQEMTTEFAFAKFLNGLNKFIGGLAEKYGNADLQSMIPDNVDIGMLGNFLKNYIN